MTIKFTILYLSLLLLLPAMAFSQSLEKISFDAADSSDGYYLAVRPRDEIKAVLVVIGSFGGAESMPPETKLQNVGFINNILTVFANMGQQIYTNGQTIHRLNAIMSDVAKRFSADTSKFVLGGFDLAGNIALRYTELTYQNPSQFPVQPKAVFTMGSFVDLTALWYWCEREIKKNFYPGTVGDAVYLKDLMQKDIGTAYDKPETYRMLSALNRGDTSAGNEQYLTHLPVRTYYDADIEWQIKYRGNSLYDTWVPDGSELINRLQLEGNKDAEFISAKQPAMRSNGMRNTDAFSMVDEAECVQWIIKALNIFVPNNPMAWVPPYKFDMPDNWTIERSPFPIFPFSKITYKGFEEIHFPPGWPDIKTDDYWTVSYLVRLNGKQPIDATALEGMFKTYFEDLVGDNIKRRNIPANKIVPISSQINKVAADAGDVATYTGVINSLDYMAQVPIAFNVKVHIKPGKNNTPILFEISPKPFTHAIWQTMEKTVKDYKDDKNAK